MKGHGYVRYRQHGWNWRLEFIHDKLIINRKDYMERWILRTKLFQLRLHKIISSDDPGRPPHDHPTFLASLILKGGYIQAVRGRPDETFTRGSFNIVPWGVAHIVTLLNEHAPTWTLVFNGPKNREWGFQTDKGWVHHEDFFGFR
tara:strand:+ start:137 stop:571 length:435 start_codon:yes stop_codon:yes gene_type:complete